MIERMTTLLALTVGISLAAASVWAADLSHEPQASEHQHHLGEDGVLVQGKNTVVFA